MRFFITLSFWIITSAIIAQPTAKLNQIGAGFTDITDIAIPDDGTGRLFIVEKGGTIRIWRNGVTEGIFLQLTDNEVFSDGERGLLGMAFHPDFASNGQFYLYYTTPGRREEFQSVISRFNVSSENPDLADPDTKLEILSFTQPFNNHNGGDIEFGPDGNLYIASGDGGSGGDPINAGQRLNTLLGKILRIHVDGEQPYEIPANNPFVNDTTQMPEIWAYGLRNPWRIGFDQVTGDLWIADVGQDAREEVNRIPNGEGGLNFGWKCFEGNEFFANCDDIQHVQPFYAYAHSDNGCTDLDFCGESITGGFVYRGSKYPDLQGKYFFADFATRLVWSLDIQTGQVVHESNIGVNTRLSTFGQSPDGEIFAASLNGTLFELVSTNVSTRTLTTAHPEVSIYPNPTRDKVIINYPHALISLELMDVTGRLMQKVTTFPANQYTLDLQDLQPGTYFLRYELDDRLYLSEVIKY